MRKRAWIWLLLIVGLAAGAVCIVSVSGRNVVAALPGETREVLLETGFETDPAAAGWKGAARRRRPRRRSSAEWIDADPHGGRHCVKVAGGIWQSPEMRIRPFEFYRVTFASKTQGKGYWLMRFFDTEGREITADQYSSIFASDEWVANESCVMGRAGTASARLGFRPNRAEIFVDDVTVTGATRTDVLKWADSLYKTLPPVRCTPEPKRWKHLPKTMDKLRKGEALKIVVLGDSIANDLCNSHFHLLAERMYPGSRITLVHSIRGATGCPYYQGGGRVKPYVVDHDPDLVIIAGISHGLSVPPIRSVIRQVREQMKAGPEFLVMTGAVLEPGMDAGMAWRGLTSPPPEVKRRAKEALTKFYAELVAARDADQFATLDLRAIWDAYIERSPRPLGWYQRDFTHANDRGKQILGRIVERFFAPDRAEAKTE